MAERVENNPPMQYVSYSFTTEYGIYYLPIVIFYKNKYQ